MIGVETFIIWLVKYQVSSVLFWDGWIERILIQLDNLSSLICTELVFSYFDEQFIWIILIGGPLQFGITHCVIFSMFIAVYYVW